MSEDNLALKLRAATHESHREAERAGVMSELLHGTLTIERYIALLVNLREVYRALESGLNVQRHSRALRAFEFKRLERAAALDADLDILGVIPSDSRGVLPLTREFTARVQRLADQPEMLLAHAYVRYLGDLNGGQMLSRLVQKLFPGKAAGATSFYRFGTPDDVKNLIVQFRKGLEQVPDNDGLYDRVIAEALRSFDFHRNLFTALAE